MNSNKFLNTHCPLLIPSFSSKGNLLIKNGDIELSDNSDLLKILTPNLYHTYLVSSYDIFYGLIPQNALEYPIAEFIMIDSGGYEISQGYDFCEHYKFNYKVKEWDETKMLEVYEKIYTSQVFNYSQLSFCTFDSNEPLVTQIGRANILKKEMPGSIIDFLIKIPNTFEDIFNKLQSEQSVMDFKVVGFTEKDLGLTLREKLLNIIQFREYADEANWDVQIHIFGGLEPTISTLYYLAGAQIFDGLSWQKVRYQDNSTLHNPNYYVVDIPENDNKYWMMVDNLKMLEKLETKLKEYGLNNDMKEVRKKFKNVLLNDDLYIYKILEQIGGL